MLQIFLFWGSLIQNKGRGRKGNRKGQGTNQKKPSLLNFLASGPEDLKELLNMWVKSVFIIMLEITTRKFKKDIYLKTTINLLHLNINNIEK